MSNVNRPLGEEIQLPRQMVQALNGRPELQREMVLFLQSIIDKVSGSSATLADVEQRSGIPSLARIQEGQKQIDDLAKSQSASMRAKAAQLDSRVDELVRAATAPLRSRVTQLESQIEEFRRQSRTMAALVEINKNLDDIEKSYRPRC